MTKVRSSSTEQHIMVAIAEIQPDIIISINNHGMTKSIRDYITVPVVRWLFDDVEHFFVHESFGDWQNSFDPDDLVICYNSELRAKIEISCPVLRRKPIFLAHATSIDLVRAIPFDPKHNISFIGSYLDVAPAQYLLQHFGAKGGHIPLAIENIVQDIRRNHQLNIREALESHDLTNEINQIRMRPDDFKRVLSDLITTRDRLEAVVSLKDLGIAVFGRSDWILPLILVPGAERVFQYDSKLDSQVALMTAYQSALITVDIPNIQNETAIGGRVIEAMSSNSLLITKFQEESDLFKVFGSDCPVPTYRDLPHLYELCSHYLNRPEEREEIVKRCNSLVANGFDFRDRVIFVLELAGQKLPSVRRRVQATIDRLPAGFIREVELNEAQNIGTGLDKLEQAVKDAAERGELETALNLLVVYAQAQWHDPGTLTKLFGSARLDELCLIIGRIADTTKPSSPTSTGSTVYIASHLAGHGGHTHVLESAVMADTTARRVILLTDLFNHADIEGLRVRFGRTCEFRAAPRGSLPSKLIWLLEQLAELRPKNILLFNHHEDAVMIAAMANWLHRASVFFIHHADTNLCYGVHLPGATHVDLHNIGFNCCRHHENIKNNRYLPLSIKEKRSRPVASAFKEQGNLRTCSSGSYNKFSGRYAFQYIDLISLRLQADHGTHIHIGGIPTHELERIRTTLERVDVNPERFIHVPWVESVWSTLVERNVDLYISSFPLSGGLATVEAMGSGTPILAHQSDMSRFHGGVDLMYPGVLTWRNAREFKAIIETVDAERLERDSRIAADWFKQHHSMEVMGEQLNQILTGGGAELQPPPLQEHKLDRLEQYQHFASLNGGQEVGGVIASMQQQQERAVAIQTGEALRLRRLIKDVTRELEQVKTETVSGYEAEIHELHRRWASTTRELERANKELEVLKAPRPAEKRGIRLRLLSKNQGD
ncbi:glycosyltransferase family protein [Methylorubrum extorquens]|uniref:glycosyltransferase family protein n=1 Tax=Methylorubrum extorquens TaxID=408 RepID=UPI001EE53937|nr:glycosyltransferase [Methylorubrum extorquens]MCG5247997.1 glycosyltransferase [Methylorubrum extorquens]